MSNLEKTLSIIKPDAVERNLENEIKEMFKRNGFSILKEKKIQIEKTEAEEPRDLRRVPRVDGARGRPRLPGEAGPRPSVQRPTKRVRDRAPRGRSARPRGACSSSGACAASGAGSCTYCDLL